MNSGVLQEGMKSVLDDIDIAGVAGKVISSFLSFRSNDLIGRIF